APDRGSGECQHHQHVGREDTTCDAATLGHGLEVPPSTSGRATVNVVPPAVEWTSTVPPCSSTIFLTTARPRPVPPCLPAVTNDWKILFSISRGIPGPVSATSMTRVLFLAPRLAW